MEQKKVKILHQPLKAKWYRMIESGEKPEEYREGFYWVKRLCRSKGDCDWGGYCAVSHCTKKGVRTDDWFDLGKVRKVLEICEPIIKDYSKED